MLVKVSTEHIVLDHLNRKLPEVDLKVEDSRIIMSFGLFTELEDIFKKIRKGLDDFSGDFEFKTK